MKDQYRTLWKALIVGFLLSTFFVYTSSALSLEGAKDAVRSQLGYLPNNYMSVSAWRQNGVEPVAIKTYPLHGGAKRRQAKAEVQGPISSPFPTLYWLTCPEISKAVAGLERRGFIQKFDQEIKSDPDLSRRLIQCHEEYAVARWNSLTEEDRSLLMSEDPCMLRMRNIMQYSGISGTNFTTHDEQDGHIFVPSIKCLHAHYAHYRSTVSSELTQSPVGEMIHANLVQEFPDLEL